nr:hypothetical protein LOC_Os12g35790 [Oryza sativa Japonica Group]
MDLPRPAPSSSNPTEIRHGRLLAMQDRWIHGSSRAFLAVQQRVVPKPELWDDAVIWEKQAVCSWKHTSVGSSISILSRAELVHKFKDMINVRLMGASPMDKFR